MDGRRTKTPCCSAHYPLVMDDICALLPRRVAVLDAPGIVAERVASVLDARKALSSSTRPTRQFEVTDWTQSFADGAAHILGTSVDLVEAPWPEVL